jgi:hypothetical protein
MWLSISAHYRPTDLTAVLKKVIEATADSDAPLAILLYDGTLEHAHPPRITADSSVRHQSPRRLYPPLTPSVPHAHIGCA